ncbi:hypothetical protein niasHT_001529 [Heterodera trifolii]|uniref:RRM domain-containing protein n=1 Tax=Heterodera trifolii TaxID=157864 RepID=A0ABD2MCC4_9BILA
MEFKCAICRVWVHSQAHWDDHLKGKVHNQNIELRATADRLMNRSVYLNNFTKPIDDSELTRTMGQFGEVDRVIMDKSGSGAFAIVEFKEEDAAQNLLNSFERLRIGKSNVRIHPRRVDFEGVATFCRSLSEQSEINSEEVLNFLNANGASDFGSQLSALVSKLSLTPNKINERAEFTQQLKTFVQPYFVSPLQIRVFGSSSTGLGFVNSDLDLNLVFDEDFINCGDFAKIPSVSSPENGPTLDDIDQQLTPEKLKRSPIDRDTFNRLPKIDRVRLLNRLINEFRKEKGSVTAHVPIPDARTPVVRFLTRLSSARVSCELSVQNLLGECKANLIRDLVRAETTGTLWRLIFFFKLWASCNGLFSPDSQLAEKKKVAEGEEGTTATSKQRSTAHPKTHWNSYALSLLVVAFLQQKNRIPPIQLLLRHNSRLVEGWPIEYDLSFFALDEGLPTLLKGLFTFLYQQIKESRVIAPRDGRMFGLDEFKSLYVDEDKRIEKKWRFSLVNIQDPLELSHNVAANVGKQSLASLRWKVMYGIAMLKRSPNDFRPLFRLNDPEQLKEERRAEKAQNQALRQQQNHGGRPGRRKGEKMETD